MKYILIFIITASGFVFAGRPIKTVDAFPLGKKFFQVEFASDACYIEDKYYVALPAVLTYGISNATDLQVGFAFFPSAKQLLNSVNVGIKQHLLTVDNFESAFTGGFNALISESGMQNPAGYINLLASISLGNFIVHGNAGYSQNLVEGEHKDIWFSSMAAEYAVTENFSLAFDAGFVRNPVMSDESLHYYSLAGVIFKVNDAISIDTGINFSHNNNLVDLISTGITAKF